jgi:hypothetical protein
MLPATRNPISGKMTAIAATMNSFRFILGKRQRREV